MKKSLRRIQIRHCCRRWLLETSSRKMLWKSFPFLLRLLLLLLLLLVVFHSIGHGLSGSQVLLARHKRDGIVTPPLVYPTGATLKLLFGYAMPIAISNRKLSYTQNFQFQFGLPQNASFFSQYYAGSKPNKRRRRRADLPPERSIAYRFIEDELSRRGGAGRDCMLRSICEAAETPLTDDGLVGEIFHVLLTPDYGGSLGVDKGYKEAADAGRKGHDCFKAYPSCPKGFGILDHISEVFDHD